MSYDFNQLIHRENTACVKYDSRQNIFGKPDVLPMWVADMDIATPGFIIEAIRERLKHPVFGYTFRDDEYINAIKWWYSNRHSWDIEGEWIDFCPGVVSGLSHAIRAFTNPGDHIIIQPPVYRPFFTTVTNNSRNLVLNPLLEVEGSYTMNLEQLEDLASRGAKMFILSNPHNPIGKLWGSDELLRLGEICLRHNIIIVSDEIHSDLIFPGKKHFSIATLNKALANITVTFSSMSKTFNLAGLASGFVIIPNAELKAKYAKELEASGAGMGNIFGFEALKAAFTPQGAEWLEKLMLHINSNWQILSQGVSKYNKLKLHQPEATYLVWADFRRANLSNEDLNNLLVHQAGLGFSPGTEYGAEGSGFQRINIACPRKTIEDAIQRFASISNHIV